MLHGVTRDSCGMCIESYKAVRSTQTRNRHCIPGHDAHNCGGEQIEHYALIFTETKDFDLLNFCAQHEPDNECNDRKLKVLKTRLHFLMISQSLKRSPSLLSILCRKSYEIDKDITCQGKSMCVLCIRSKMSPSA